MTLSFVKGQPRPNGSLIVVNLWGFHLYDEVPKMQVLWQITLVSLGSAFGGLTRWTVTLLSVRFFGRELPWGTLIINLSGSFFLGWFMTWIGKHVQAEENALLKAEDLRLLIAVGFTGAYTTFSTYEYESNALLEKGQTGPALVYLCASMVLGLLAVRAGIWFGK